MSREVNRTKVVERPACHIKKLAPQGERGALKDL